MSRTISWLAVAVVALAVVACTDVSGPDVGPEVGADVGPGVGPDVSTGVDRGEDPHDRHPGAGETDGLGAADGPGDPDEAAPAPPWSGDPPPPTPDPQDQPEPGPYPRNQVGRVPILLYHRIGESEGRWTRTPAGFYGDLKQLYEAGFRPIRLRDYLDQRIDLPPGYAPVILTFDDGTADQFRWDEDGAPAPDSAVGVLLRFAAEHPDWDATAAFFVNADPFRNDSQAKARWLVEHGFEVENHTWLHADLGRIDAAGATAELGRMSAWIEQATGRPPVAVALPFGARPRTVEPVLAGDHDGHAYRHEALLEVGWGPARSPFDPDFDPLRLPRIQVADPDQVSAADLPSIWDTWFERLLEGGDVFAN